MTTVMETAVTTQVYRVYIKATPQAVWDAITNPEWTERYGFGGRVEYELHPGGSYRVPTTEAMKKAGAHMGISVPEVMVDGEVIEADPPRKLALTWRMVMDPESMAERYADLFTEHLRVRYFPEEYLADVDDAFYSAQYLRAWTFEVQLREYLKREFDEEWFHAPRAGRFLRDLWRDGQKYTADELVKFMGYDELDPSLMLAEIEEALAR